MRKSDKLVMIVDDEPNFCSILKRILSGEGYKVVAATDGETAFKLFEECNPNAVLLDLALPGINGREICRRMKEVQIKIKIIYLSAKAAPIDTAELRELKSEADGYIAKPATSRQILSGIRKVLTNGG